MKMNKIEQKTYKKDEYLASELFCVICMNEYEEEAKISILPCNKEYLKNILVKFHYLLLDIFFMKIALKNGWY